MDIDQNIKIDPNEFFVLSKDPSILADIAPKKQLDPNAPGVVSPIHMARAVVNFIKNPLLPNEFFDNYENEIMENSVDNELLAENIRSIFSTNNHISEKLINTKLLAKALQIEFDRYESDFSGNAKPKDVVNLFESFLDGYKQGEMVKTGFKWLDHKLGGGYVKNALHIIAAKTGCGKSSIALQMAVNMAKEGKRVLFISLEMSLHQYAARCASLLDSALNSKEILHGRLTPEGKERLKEVNHKFAQLPLSFCEVHTISEIIKTIEECEDKPDIIFIDYIQLVGSSLSSNLNPEAQIAYVVKKLKFFINKLELCVVALAQQNEKPFHKVPTVANLRSSTSIGHYAETISFVCHQEETDDSSPETWVEVIKNRNGGEPNAPRITFDYDHFWKTGVFIEEHSERKMNNEGKETKAGNSTEAQKTTGNFLRGSTKNVVPKLLVPPSKIPNK